MDEMMARFARAWTWMGCGSYLMFFLLEISSFYYFISFYQKEGI